MRSRPLLANTCLARCLLVVFRSLFQAVVALSTGNDLGKRQYQRSFRVVSMSELTCRRCGISNPQEFDIPAFIVDTSLVSCITQIHKSALLCRTKCHCRKKTREKEAAHLTQVEDSCKQ